ncbi:MAG: hypothetical protein ACJA08_001558 [Cyclobacteriaceae bacterium]|jgi:hypothetical protein
MIIRSYILSVALLISTLVFGQSVLSTGGWHKIGVAESGVYKIDRDFLSKDLKINVSSLDPRTVKIYGTGGGGTLPQANSVFRYNDPPQNAIYEVGAADGSMDKDDYFVFYGNSPHKIKLQSDGSMDYDKNNYSDTTYYFLTYGGDPGLRLSTIQNPSSGGNLKNTFHDYVILEDDEDNILNSGREWYSFPYSDAFVNSASKSFDFNIAGIQDSVGMEILFLGASEFPASFSVSLNESLLGNVPVAAISSSTYTDRAFEYFKYYTIENNTSQDLNVKIVFNPEGVGVGTSQGYLDYFILGFERELKLYGDQTLFRNRKSLIQNSSYTINTNGLSNLMIWNVSEVIHPKIQTYVSSPTSITFNEEVPDQINEYVVFNALNLINPISFGTIENQNIKSVTAVDGIIISAPQFVSQAKRLADFHQSHDGLNVAIVTPREIYNEFSSGMQDVSAIRDYLRYVWNNGNQQLKYALLFGDGSYDYKKILKKHNVPALKVLSDHNFVPVYESKESIHRLYSHSSDDYYGFFEEDEGDWYEGDQSPTGTPTRYIDHTLEIGIGRIPVTTLDEAKDVVDKIIRYVTSVNTLGKWRTEFAYIADDGDDNIHMRDVEGLNQIISDSHPQYDASRLFLDNFEQPNYKSPRMRLAIEEKFADGALVIDYLGHGGPDKLMQETVIDAPFITKLNNRHKLPLMVTATCNFGVYDDPSTTSGAEEMLLSPNGGAIAMITTTRAVFAQTNYLVNSAFHESIFLRENGIPIRLGDIMRLTKNNSLSGPINRNFALLGDPMLTLNYPKYEIRFDGLDEKLDTLSALEQVTVTGHVYQGETILDTFNGTATVTVWDIPRQKITLGIDNPEAKNLGLPLEVNDPFTYTEQDNALFRGDVTVSGGAFTSTFLLPKNSSYKYERGRIKVYASNEDDFIDASGGTQNIVIGGSGALVDDQTAPSILSVYLNEPSFRNGDVVGPSSLFIAKLADENGINISTNGFNQNITLNLNDTLELVLNDFYTSSLDDYTTGTIIYPIENFPKGTYSGRLKVWDSYNNYSTKYVEFKVSDKPKIRLFNVINYPNPVSFNGETTFSFEHDRLGEELIVKIAIYDMMGSKLNEWGFELDDVSTKVDRLTKFAVNQKGDRLKNGVYFYKLQVTSTADGASNEVINRLLINY